MMTPTHTSRAALQTLYASNLAEVESTVKRRLVIMGENMKVERENRNEFGAFSRLDWPAFELLRDVEQPQARASDEAFQLNWSASELLREARRTRAETMRRLLLRLVHELREFIATRLFARMKGRRK
jgi:hypothetical protein